MSFEARVSVARKKGNVQWVFPWVKWQDRKEVFLGSRFEMEHICAQLERLNYPMDIKEPDERTIKVTSTLLNLLEKHEWVVFMSNDFDLLQAIASTVPMTRAMTFALSCFTITTSQMVDLFSENPTFDDHGVSIVYDTIDEITKSSLLLWDGIENYTKGCSQFTGRFSDLFKDRWGWKRATLMTTSIMDVAKLLPKIEKSLGETVASLISAKSEFIFSKVDTRKITPRSLGV